MTRRWIACAAMLAALGEARAEPADEVGPDGLTAADRALLEASEVIAVEHQSDAEVVRESARAVTVVELRDAHARAADLGEVLSRTQGIQVRRTGGLGSAARFSLNGLYDDQVRFFLDGVPLHLAGWGVGIANVPVELIERVDVHRGVVPIALGADALGGAVDLVTDPRWVDRAAASASLGSFGAARGALTMRARTAGGLALGLTAFVDRARNDDPITVAIADATGAQRAATVPRFHDGYLAAGGSVELGVVDRGWLRRATVRLHASQYGKELPHNLVMTIPYGEASYGEAARGAIADATLEPPGWRIRALAGAARRRIAFHDTATAVYDWRGRPILERATAGETASSPTDQVVREVAWFARLTASRALGAHHELRIAIAPTAVRRTGDDLLDTNPTGRDPIDARREVAQLITGVEHELRLGPLANVAFAKHYAMWTDAEEVQPGYVFVPVASRTRRFGLGDALRYRARPWLDLKASYEWATRLPSVDELFGNGVLIDPNLALAPERSHNANLEAIVAHDGPRGTITAQLDGFARLADQLIFLAPSDRRSSYRNVWRARILGAEASARWAAPDGWATVEGSVTLQDLRNASSDGPFGAYEGDRIPSRPWLLGALGGSLRARDVGLRGGDLTAYANSRYVHAFFRGWESLGRRDSKQVVPAQLVHAAGLTYALHGAELYTATLEVQNLTDAKAYDSFGAVRPGRAVVVKLGVEL